MNTNQSADQRDDRTKEQRQRDLDNAAAFYECAVMMEQFERMMK